MRPYLYIQTMLRRRRICSAILLRPSIWRKQQEPQPSFPLHPEPSYISDDSKMELTTLILTIRVVAMFRAVMGFLLLFIIAIILEQRKCSGEKYSIPYENAGQKQKWWPIDWLFAMFRAVMGFLLLFIIAMRLKQRKRCDITYSILYFLKVPGKAAVITHRLSFEH